MLKYNINKKRSVLTIGCGIILLITMVSAYAYTCGGYIINNGNMPVYSYNLKTGPVNPILPFTQTGQSAYSYLQSMQYTQETDESGKIVLFTTTPSSTVNPNTHGCAFIMSADSNTYYISAAALDEYSKCSVEESQGSGFSKKNMLVINVTS